MAIVGNGSVYFIFLYQLSEIMKKIIIIALLLAIVSGAYFFSGTDSGETAVTNKAKQLTQRLQDDLSGKSPDSPALPGQDNSAKEYDVEEMMEFDERKASEVYHTADEALTAIKQAALEYDDLVLERFSNIGEGCAWCPDFYAAVKDMLLSPSVDSDQKSYYAEVLAVSGDINNIKTLVDATLNAPNSENAEIFAEALEISNLDEDGLLMLKEHLNSSNPTLQEATVAAFTYQGSRLAVETLYQKTLDNGDPDGYYSLGIGLGEVIPDPESIPLLQEVMSKRDQYSHLAVKALLNGGLPGLMIVFDGLNVSSNPTFDKENLLKDAIDHVSYDEQTENYLQQQIQSSKNPVAVEFAKEILKDFELEDEFEEELEEDPEEDY